MGESVSHVFTSTEVELSNGRAFDVTNPDPSAIDIGVIAHGLSCVGRYGGMAVAFHSVAEHSVFVAEKLRRIGACPQLQMAGLLHDAQEALDGFGDIQRPAKGLLGADYHARVRAIDDAIWRAVGNVNGLLLYEPSMLHDPLVKRVDNFCLLFEAKWLMVSEGVGWEQHDAGAHPVPEHVEDEVRCWLPLVARQAFLDHHFLLCGEAVRDRG